MKKLGIAATSVSICFLILGKICANLRGLNILRDLSEPKTL